MHSSIITHHHLWSPAAPDERRGGAGGGRRRMIAPGRRMMNHLLTKQQDNKKKRGGWCWKTAINTAGNEVVVDCWRSSHPLFRFCKTPSRAYEYVEPSRNLILFVNYCTRSNSWYLCCSCDDCRPCYIEKWQSIYNIQYDEGAIDNNLYHLIKSIRFGTWFADPLIILRIALSFLNLTLTLDMPCSPFHHTRY